nr:hypothetical protein [Tanacetum cinerariifolium]
MAEREEIPDADLPLQKRLCTAYTGTYELGESSATDPEDDPKEDHADYPANGGDEGDDRNESFNDDEDDDIDIEGDDAEDEYLAPADSTTVALPVVDHAPSAEETTLCTAHTGTYELGESSKETVARIKEPVRDDLYRRYHAHTARLMKGEARASRTAWAQSMDASDTARSGVIALRTQVLAQRTEIIDLRAADRRFQTTVETHQEEIRELWAADRKLQAQFIQALTALKSCQT